MTFSRGRGRGRSHNFGGRGRGFVGGERESASWKGPRQCRHCRRSNHISEKYWEKFERPEDSYLILVLLPRVVLLKVLHLLFMTLPQLYCRRSMIDSDS